MKTRLYKKETVYAVITITTTSKRFLVIDPNPRRVDRSLKFAQDGQDAWVVTSDDTTVMVKNPESPDGWVVCHPIPRVLVLPDSGIEYYIEVIEPRVCYVWTSELVDVPLEINED